MKVIIVDDKKKDNKKGQARNEYKLNLFLEWLIYMLGYAVVLLITSSLFRALYVDGIWYGLLAAILIFIFNKTIKPILVTLTLPIIGLSLGLFYFVINVFILLLVSLLLGSHFELTGILSPIIVSMFISLMNILMEGIVIKPLIERWNKR